MRSLSISRFLLILALLVFAATYDASAAQVVSTSKNVRAVMQDRGFYIVPAGTMAVAYGSSDLAPIQSFEIVRPRGEEITIGRLYTSCTCVQLEAPRRSFGRGERAVLNLRNVIATPPGGQTYAIYVQITSPIRTTLRYDTFVQSSHFVSAPPVIAPHDIEVIVPHTEDAVAKAAEEKKEVSEDLDTASRGIQTDSDTEEKTAESETGAEEILAEAKTTAEAKTDEAKAGGEREGSGEKVAETVEEKNETEAKSTAAEDEDAAPAEPAAVSETESEADPTPVSKEEAGKPEVDNAASDTPPEDTEDVVDVGDVVDEGDSVNIQDVVDPGVKSKRIL